MPVNTPHIDYSRRKSDWAKIRTFVEGARAVRAAGESYLPMLKGWTKEQYDAYKARAEVYGAADRTIDGLDGAIFRKTPQIEVPEGQMAIIEDITLSGQSINEWLRGTVREILTVGRLGALVDFSRAEQTNPDVVITGPNRPYVVSYTAEQIINWESQVIDGVTKLTLVVLEESVSTPSPSDPFVKVPALRYRVLRLVENRYVVEIWTAKSTPGLPGSTTPSKDVEYEKTAELKPDRRGIPLDKIPFFFISPSGQEVCPEKPPLLDIVDLCVLHYMTSADYSHGLHWVALPTPWATGVREKDKIAIGPSSAIILEDKDAKVGMLEFAGTGLSAIKDRLEGLERKMAALGARILEDQKREAESGEALKLRQGGDASVLAGISDAVSRSAEAIVKRMLWWDGTEANEPDVTIDLNMDFYGAAMDPQTLVALIQARQAGLISTDTFLWNLKRGEMMPEDVSIEDERAKIEADPPELPAPAGAPAGGKGGK